MMSDAEELKEKARKAWEALIAVCEEVQEKNFYLTIHYQGFGGHGSYSFHLNPRDTTVSISYRGQDVIYPEKAP